MNARTRKFARDLERLARGDARMRKAIHGLTKMMRDGNLSVAKPNDPNAHTLPEWAKLLRR